MRALALLLPSASAEEACCHIIYTDTPKAASARRPQKKEKRGGGGAALGFLLCIVFSLLYFSSKQTKQTNGFCGAPATHRCARVVGGETEWRGASVDRQGEEARGSCCCCCRRGCGHADGAARVFRVLCCQASDSPTRALTTQPGASSDLSPSSHSPSNAVFLSATPFAWRAPTCCVSSPSTHCKRVCVLFSERRARARISFLCVFGAQLLVLRPPCALSKHKATPRRRRRFV